MKEVLKEVGGLWKRRVKPYDAFVIEDLFLNYDLEPDTILYLMRYAIEKGADTLNYLYPLAQVLKENGITDVTEAELTLERKFEKYTRILFFIHRKKKLPTRGEKEKIDEIMDKYHPTNEEIVKVGKLTKKAKNPSLRYFEAVMEQKRKETA